MGRPKKIRGAFSKIPEVIRKEGRVKGFEALRDFALDNWEFLKGNMNPYSAIKLALEADRHALFAEIAEMRKQGKFDVELYHDLSDFLKGKVDFSPDSSGEKVDIQPPTGVAVGHADQAMEMIGQQLREDAERYSDESDDEDE